MKRIIAAIFHFGTLATFAQTQFPPKDRMVIVISLDGFPGFALEDAWLLRFPGATCPHTEHRCDV